MPHGRRHLRLPGDPACDARSTGASFDTLVTGPSSSALVGIYTDPSGTQEMVETFDQNQNQLQAELLRHGALNWVTRGVYFGDQRNYLETNIDDNFLPDDTWSTATHATDYTPADALREEPGDVDNAAKWSASNNFRIDQLFNGGGSATYAESQTSGHRSAADGVPDLHELLRVDQPHLGSPEPRQRLRDQAYIEAEIARTTPGRVDARSD